MSGASFLIAKCCCGVDVGWCDGIVCNTSNPNGPVKIDCRGNQTVSLNFGLSAAFFNIDIQPETTPPADPDLGASISFLPKQRMLIDPEDPSSATCTWTWGYGNLDGEFYRDRECFDDLTSSIIAANKDRWLYRQEAGIGINSITGTFAEEIAPTLPDGVDRDDPTDQANWRLIVAYALVDGLYAPTAGGSWHFPTNNTSKMGIYFFSVKYVLVSEICAGNTITMSNQVYDGIPDVAPFNTYEPMPDCTGTMSVLFNPDVPDNTHLATDLSPAYTITFYVCKMSGESDVSYTREVTAFQNAYPDSRSWGGTSSDGVAALQLFRFGQQVQVAEYAPGDGDETLFTITANVAGEGFDIIDIDSDAEYLVPIGRRVYIYEDESEGFTVQVEVTASGDMPPYYEPPCPEE